MILIIDYGMGNIGSLENILNSLGCDVRIGNKSEDFQKAQKIIIPGVGSFSEAIKRIDQLDLRRSIVNAYERNIPTLGICLGMQILLEESEEGEGNGLSLIKGKVVKFQNEDKQIKLPRMEWGEINLDTNVPIFSGIPNYSKFYFVHSYHAYVNNEQDIIATSFCGYEYTCSVKSKNLYGVQYHPEKSLKIGNKLIKNFVSL